MYIDMMSWGDYLPGVFLVKPRTQSSNVETLIKSQLRGKVQGHIMAKLICGALVLFYKIIGQHYVTLGSLMIINT